jgi:DNA-binding MarR family transcriptional regulator
MHWAAGGWHGGDDPPMPIRLRLGYLLKHVQLEWFARSTAALAPYRIDGRELAVLGSLSKQHLLSQQEVARRLRIDRTTMVALIDGLERKQLVQRTPHPDDRRKNTVELTAAGRAALAAADRAADEAEQRFLGPLGEAGAEQFVGALHALLAAATATPAEPDPPTDPAGTADGE